MKFDLKSYIAIAAALAVIFFAYRYFFVSEGNDQPITEIAPDSPTQAHFKSLVSQLEHISFNTNIFSDVRFASLVDLTTPIAPESAGRIDPFASIPGIAGE